MFMGIGQWLEEIVHALREIRDALRALKPQLYTFEVSQGERMLTGVITGLAPGASDTFFATPVDTNGNADALPAGSSVPGWASDDTTVGVVAAAGGLSAQLTASANATPGGSFNVTVTSTLPNGVVIQSKFNVPYLALQPVGFVFSQGSPAK
jgi:hypothetical protein